MKTPESGRTRIFTVAQEQIGTQVPDYCLNLTKARPGKT